MTQSNKTTEELLGTGSIGMLIARFAIPSVTAMLVNALYNIVDQIFIGRSVGYLGNAAANIVLLMSMMTLSLSLLIGDGAAAYFSIKLGTGDKDKSQKCAGNATALITAASLVIMILGILWLEPILKLFGCTDVILPYAMDYGFIVVLGMPFMMISTSVNSLIRTDGSPRYAMASMIAGALVNGCLDPVFIFVFGWGIKGAAISSFIGQFISFVMSVLYLMRMKSVQLKLQDFRLQFSLMREFLSLGISSFIDQISFTLVMAVNNNLIVHYGMQSVYGSEIPLTAYGISMKVQEILFTVLLGIGIGLQPIAGYNYGAGNYKRVKKAYLIAIAIGTVISGAASLVFLVGPEYIIGIFGSSENAMYMEFVSRFFRTYFLFYIMFGFQTITGIFFQAVGKPKQAAAVSLSYQLIFKIGSALVLTSFIGLDGVLWSGPAADAMAFILSGALIIMHFKKPDLNR